MSESFCPINSLAVRIGLPECNSQCNEFETDLPLEFGPSCPNTSNDSVFEKIVIEWDKVDLDMLPNGIEKS